MVDDGDRKVVGDNVEERDLSPEDEGEEAIEIVPVDTGDREGEEYLLEEETALDNLVIEEGEEAIIEEMQAETEDEFVQEEFAERQQLAGSGREELEEELEEHQGVSPNLSGDDIDAAWEDSIQAGEEAVGGSAPTPDQDQVDALGDALGISYEADEPLHTEEKLLQRDRERWELDPASDEAYSEEEEEEENE